MTLAPLTSPHPPIRPDPTFWDRLNVVVNGHLSADLAEAASAQALVLFFWLLVLMSLSIWVRRRAAAGDLRMFGSWRRYRVTPDDVQNRPCRWQVGAARMASGAQKWSCDVCGRDGFSSTREPPEGCNWIG